jgi:hypothetical protein
MKMISDHLSFSPPFCGLKSPARSPFLLLAPRCKKNIIFFPSDQIQIIYFNAIFEYSSHVRPFQFRI